MASSFHCDTQHKQAGIHITDGHVKAHCILARSRAADTVVSGLEGSIAPVLQAVPNVDGDCPRHWVERHPLGILCLLSVCCQTRAHLQPCLACAT